ncbi:hypothetical protein GCM10022226_45700 [Sphaerisporangium flaviroseum]|uniref:WD40 repeat domain-containing protein n=1 Tax=Sphaerisporangium flaviroseum TaxID=509199 RepID=A0ABP7IK06_9ACTN
MNSQARRCSSVIYNEPDPLIRHLRNHDRRHAAPRGPVEAGPLPHEWGTGDRDALGHRRELGEAARRWARNGRRPEDLLRGTALRQTLEWTASTHLTLNTTEREFVEASRTGSARQSRRRRLVTTSVVVLLIASLTAGVLAWQQSARSDETGRHLADERAKATARRLALQADALRGTDPVMATLLGVAAYRIARVPEAGSAVLSSLAQQERSVFMAPTPANEGRALSPDGRTLVSAGADRVTAYDVATGRPVRTFTGIGEAPVTAAVGPDGDTLALARGSRMELWSLRTGKRLGGGKWLPESSSDDGRPESIEFSPGGGYIVVRDNMRSGGWRSRRRARWAPRRTGAGRWPCGTPAPGAPRDRCSGCRVTWWEPGSPPTGGSWRSP